MLDAHPEFSSGLEPRLALNPRKQTVFRSASLPSPESFWRRMEPLPKARVRERLTITGRRGPKGRSADMSTAVRLLARLRRDEEGAALVEYTVLLGIMLVAVITTIGAPAAAF